MAGAYGGIKVSATNSLPGEVVAVAASFDETLKFGAQTPFSDQLAGHWAGSMWQYDAQHDSVITVGNGGTKPTQAAFTILYNQGTQKYELEQTLQPNEQMWIDIGKQIRESVPDKNGKLLPADLASGSYEIRDLTNKGIGTLFEGKVIFDKTYGHVTYGCGSCCGFKGGLKLWYNPLGIPFQGTSDNGATCIGTCAGQWEDVSDSIYGSWSTANTSIATVDYYGTHTGQSIGSTTSATGGFLYAASPKTTCPLSYFGGNGADKVGNPAQLLVIGDTTTNPTNCPNTKLRILAYQIQDMNGNDITGDVQTKEQFSAKGANTCNTQITTSETCSGTPNGIIHDSLSVGCNTVDNGCGYTYKNQQWVWCNGATNTVIGTVGDLVVHDNAISVGGSYTSTQGKTIKP